MLIHVQNAKWPNTASIISDTDISTVAYSTILIVHQIIEKLFNTLLIHYIHVFPVFVFVIAIAVFVVAVAVESI